MAALSSIAKGAARSGAAGGSLPYLDKCLDFRPLSIPQQQALALRDELAACHEQAGNLYRRQRLLGCGQPVPGGMDTWTYQCGLGECPLCFRRRAYRKAAQAARMDKELQGGEFTSQMLTVSVADTEAGGIAARYAELSEGCSRLYRSKIYARHVEGAARGIEIGMADTGLFHTHLHQLLIFRETALPEEILPLVQRCFPQGLLYLSEPLNGICLARFVGYVLKLPKDVSAVEWLTIRQIMQGKIPLTFSGILKKVRKMQRKSRKSAFPQKEILQ